VPWLDYTPQSHSSVSNVNFDIEGGAITLEASTLTITPPMRSI